ncbi:MAG TPA: hypothetical protein VM843_07120, partial [Flavisolibacter sp.]|nr:hypothetical protein [Flavisolibacter sp.]
MEVLLCAATAFEIQPTIEFIQQEQLQQQVGIMITGVGLVAATHGITKGIMNHAPELILQGGIAGSFHASLPLASVVTVVNET